MPTARAAAAPRFAALLIPLIGMCVIIALLARPRLSREPAYQEKIVGCGPAPQVYQIERLAPCGKGFRIRSRSTRTSVRLFRKRRDEISIFCIGRPEREDRRPGFNLSVIAAMALALLEPRAGVADEMLGRMIDVDQDQHRGVGRALRDGNLPVLPQAQRNPLGAEYSAGPSATSLRAGAGGRRCHWITSGISSTTVSLPIRGSRSTASAVYSRGQPADDRHPDLHHGSSARAIWARAISPSTNWLDIRVAFIQLDPQIVLALQGEAATAQHKFSDRGSVPRQALQTSGSCTCRSPAEAATGIFFVHPRTCRIVSYGLSGRPFFPPDPDHSRWLGPALSPG